MRLTGKTALALAILASAIIAIPAVTAELQSNVHSSLPAASPAAAPSDGQGPSYSGIVDARGMGNSTTTGPRLYVVTSGWGIGEYNPYTMVGNSSGVERHMYTDTELDRIALNSPGRTIYVSSDNLKIYQLDTMAYSLFDGSPGNVPSGSIAVKSNSVTASGSCPLRASRDGNYLYFMNGTTLYRMDWSKSTTSTLDLGNSGNAMALTGDGSTLYVNLWVPSCIVVVDTSTMAEIRRISYPYNVFVTGLALDSAGERLYASAGHWSLKMPTVMVVDTSSGGIVDTIYLGAKYGMATDLVVDPNPGNNRLYVAWSSGDNAKPGNISCISTVDHSVLRNITIGQNLQRIVALNGTRYLYVSSNDYNLYRIDMSVYPPAIFNATVYAYRITDLAIG